MRELGVGLVYWSALAPLFESGEAAVLELEPQTLWTKAASTLGFVYRLNEPLFESIACLPQAKLMHGVGQPVGGSVDDPLEHLPLLRRMAERLRPAWASEHLSFNRVCRGGRVAECGFLLPPRQSPASVRVAADKLRRYRKALGCLVAFETGVNYLRRGTDELDDGVFFHAVAEQADSGILLDLHNLWCNQRNGRQNLADALTQMPLERVWEVHLAGGMALDGYWLDAHSDGVPPPLLELAAQIIPRLPNVSALIFEILPEHLANLGLDGVQRQLEALRALWNTRPPRRLTVPHPERRVPVARPSATDRVEVRAWEIALSEALDGDTRLPLSKDPGCAVLRRLIGDLRSANLTKGLRFTITALLAGLGALATERLLAQYFRGTPADAFVAVEAHQFARFLSCQSSVLEAVPYLAEVLAFEKALLAATLYGETTELHWTADPTQLLDELDAGRLPRALPHSASSMTITV
jgi:uncharacterized protein